MTITIKHTTDHLKIEQGFAIRREVFVEEQGFPPDEDIDGLDPVCDQFLVYDDTTPIGTARVLYHDEGAKIQRVAILKHARGQGLGQKLMIHILDFLMKKSDIHTVKLGAQLHAIPFYEKLGFRICSEVYLDCDQKHRDMVMVFEREL